MRILILAMALMMTSNLMACEECLGEIQMWKFISEREINQDNYEWDRDMFYYQMGRYHTFEICENIITNHHEELMKTNKD